MRMLNRSGRRVKPSTHTHTTAHMAGRVAGYDAALPAARETKVADTRGNLRHTAARTRVSMTNWGRRPGEAAPMSQEFVTNS